MKYKINKKHGQCQFEEYDNEKKEICNCMADSIVTAGRKYVCSYHLPHVLMTDAKPELENMNGKAVKFKSDFISLAKGEKIKKCQLLMEF